MLIHASALLFAVSLNAADFYVAPSGSDTSPGTQRRPFATLARARDAVRERKQRTPDRDYSVLLRGGVYRLREAVKFSLADSAAPGRTITYAAYPGETPVFSSSVPVSGWKQEGKLWVAAVPDSLKPFRTLYDKTGRLPRARSAPFSPTRSFATGTDLDRFTLPFPKGALKSWANIEDVEIAIRPSYGWILNILPLQSVDEKTGFARTKIPASYQMVRVRWGLRDVNAKGTAWVENTVEAIDEPGEWALDTRQKKLYLLPRGGQPEGVEAPQLTELIHIEGSIDYDGPRDRPVQGLVFRGLSFTRADRWPWEKDRNGSTLQHDWEMFDRPTAMVGLRGAENVAFEKCRWFDSGSAAIRLDLHAQDNRVSDSVIEHIGGAGIVLAGYGPGSKNVSRRNQILRNHIHHVGEILWHAAAISVWQSGENRVANNLIHHTNYTAITVSGRINWNREGRGDGWRTIRWSEIEAAKNPALLPVAGYRPSWDLREPYLHGRNNIVERNEIHDVMLKLWDGDAIYVSGTGGGNRVRENFIHDCMSENMCEAIRCDDDQNNTWIERNAILRISGMGTGVAFKGTNHVLNNFIVNAVGTFQPRGLISAEGIPVEGSMIQRNVLVADKGSPRPFFWKNLMGPPDPRIEDTKTDFNLYWNASDPRWADEHLAASRGAGAEKNSASGDPLFVDPDRGDFRFRPGSPAEKLGIQGIDLRKVGLRQ